METHTSKREKRRDEIGRAHTKPQARTEQLLNRTRPTDAH